MLSKVGILPSPGGAQFSPSGADCGIQPCPVNCLGASIPGSPTVPVTTLRPTAGRRPTPGKLMHVPGDTI